MTTRAQKACHCCGLVQRVPPVGRGERAHCVRCGTRLGHARPPRAAARTTAACALSALILYPLAVGLPIMSIERFGHASEQSLLSGTAALLANGQLFVGGVVFVCSIVLPLGKLVGLLVITAEGLLSHRHRALFYRVIEWTGRWGMLDVLLLALLVAFLKVGDLVDVTPGPAALAFTLVVGLSLLASAAFDPHALWEEAT